MYVNPIHSLVDCWASATLHKTVPICMSTIWILLWIWKQVSLCTKLCLHVCYPYEFTCGLHSQCCAAQNWAYFYVNPMLSPVDCRDSVTLHKDEPTSMLTLCIQLWIADPASLWTKLCLYLCYPYAFTCELQKQYQSSQSCAFTYVKPMHSPLNCRASVTLQKAETICVLTLWIHLWIAERVSLHTKLRLYVFTCVCIHLCIPEQASLWTKLCLNVC